MKKELKSSLKTDGGGGTLQAGSERLHEGLEGVTSERVEGDETERPEDARHGKKV